MLGGNLEEESEARAKENRAVKTNPEELGVTIEGIRETRSKYLLVELKCAVKDRGRLDSAFRDVV